MREPTADGALAKSKIYQAIAQARASLSEPSRPFTPAEGSRHLFRPTAGLDTSSRPSSAFKIGAAHFIVGGAGASLRPSQVGEEVLQLRDAAGRADEGGAPLQQQRWWDRTEALLHDLRPGAPVEPVIAACDRLWQHLSPPNGPGGPAGVAPAPATEQARRQKRILAAVAALMERRETPVLLRLCRLVLCATADESAQLGACKLVFKLSKSEVNDSLFRELGMLPLLLSCVQGTAAARSSSSGSGGIEAALYAAGALKNVSADAYNQRSLVQLGAVGTLACVLRRQTTTLSAMPPLPPTPRRSAAAPAASSLEPAVRPVHLLVQLSATLRNLAVSGSSRKQFVGSGCVEDLCTLLHTTPQHSELCMNVSRVLAKLSLHEDVRARIGADPRHLSALVQVPSTHHTHTHHPPNPKHHCTTNYRRAASAQSLRHHTTQTPHHSDTTPPRYYTTQTPHHSHHITHTTHTTHTTRLRHHTTQSIPLRHHTTRQYTPSPTHLPGCPSQPPAPYTPPRESCLANLASRILAGRPAAP